MDYLLPLFRIISVIGFTLTTIASPCAYASPVNPSFEDGLTGWTSVGIVSTTGSTFGITPTHGVQQAIIQNQDAAGNGASGLALEQFLGFSPGLFASIATAEVADGAAIRTSFFAEAGSTLQFDWRFLTNEFPNAPPPVGAGNPFPNDMSFSVIENTHSGARTIALLADTMGVLDASSTVFLGDTPSATFSYVLTEPGEYSLIVGTTNVGDNEVNSGLIIDNIEILNLSVAGDYDSDSDVDGGDFLIWQRDFGMTGSDLAADGKR